MIRVIKHNEKARLDRVARRNDLACAIELVWESMRSHLGAAIKAVDNQGNEEWNARCVLDYSKIINVLSRELHELSRIDSTMSFAAADGPLAKAACRSPAVRVSGAARA